MNRNRLVAVGAISWTVTAATLACNHTPLAAPKIAARSESKSLPTPIHAKATRTATNFLTPVNTAALEGNMREGMDLLATIPVDALDDAERSTAECLRRTFVEKKPPPLETSDPFVVALVAIYRVYWTRVLLQEQSAEQGRRYLFEQLKSFLRRSGHDSAGYASLDNLLDGLGPILLAKGFHSLRGVTEPYYDLMIWETESKMTYEVALPETRIPVTVVFLKDFAVLGWSALATCNTRYTGGWAEKDVLYCVAARYKDTADEYFTVSYLAHEAQHFADYARFPKLESPELEYRAKLAEVIESRKTTHTILSWFSSQLGEHRSAPHNFANHQLVSGLSRSLLGSEVPVRDMKRWKSVDAAAIRNAALELLTSNTETLLSRGRDVSKVFDE